MLGLLACSGPQQKHSPDREIFPGPSSAVDFTLPMLRGGSLVLSSLRGKPVVLALFSTWDMRCQAEAPLFTRLRERFGPRGLEVIGVSVAAPGNRSVVLVKTYAEVMGLRHTVLLAGPQDLELVGALGQTRQVPRTVLLDSRGRIVLDMMGHTDFPALRLALERLLSGPGTGK